LRYNPDKLDELGRVREWHGIWKYWNNSEHVMFFELVRKYRRKSVEAVKKSWHAEVQRLHLEKAAAVRVEDFLLAKSLKARIVELMAHAS